MIELKDIAKTFGGKQVLKDINFHVKEGEIFGVIGLSGAGKSTLLRIINGLEPQTSGEVVLDESIRFGFVFQNFNLVNSLTAYDNVKLALLNSGLDKNVIEKKVSDALRLVNMQDHHEKYPRMLSGGERQRIGIARALVSDANVLLCDEATSALDPFTANEIIGLLKKLNKELNLTIVFVSHQLEIIKDFCDSVAIVDTGKVLEVSSAIELFSNPKSQISIKLLSGILGFDECVGYNYLTVYGDDIQRTIKELVTDDIEIKGLYQHHTRQGTFAHIFIPQVKDAKYQVRSNDGL